MPGDSLLAALGDLEVWLAGADAIPNVLREIGRLRELTYREADKAAGHSVARGAFDTGCRHLVLWNAATREIAGACRMGLSEELVDMRDGDGFCPHGLLRPDAGLLRRLGPCLELGSSFVAPACQSNPHLMTRFMGAAGWEGFCETHHARGSKPGGNPAPTE